MKLGTVFFPPFLSCSLLFSPLAVQSLLQHESAAPSLASLAFSCVFSHALAPFPASSSRLAGPELSDFIRWQPLRRLPVDRACRFFCHLLAALNHAHARGIVHCDIKPENIRLDATCAHVVLTDWGLALSPGVKDEPVLRGTPRARWREGERPRAHSHLHTRPCSRTAAIGRHAAPVHE
eukprot:6190630-Pleurochrysis_carterae.AAC.2